MKFCKTHIAAKCLDCTLEEFKGVGREFVDALVYWLPRM